MTEFADQIEMELPHLRRYARFLERDIGRTDDLVHDAVVRALRFRDRFRPDTNLRAWLITIVHNVFVNQVRSAARNTRSLDSDEVALPRSDPSQEVAILIDECSISSAEILSGGLQDIGIGRVFGGRSAGLALPSTVIKLPNGDGFQYAIADYKSASGKSLEMDGVTPDEPVDLSKELLLRDSDPVLNRALQWIKQKNENK